MLIKPEKDLETRSLPWKPDTNRQSVSRDANAEGLAVAVVMHAAEQIIWNDVCLRDVCNCTKCCSIPMQVRENRAQREAERQRQQRERDVLRAAREEAKKREQEEEMRKRQEKRRQEEMVQQEMVRLRRQMEERRGLEQTVRQRQEKITTSRFITQQITLFVIWLASPSFLVERMDQW